MFVDRDDIFGDGVNVAARLEGLADPGGICISESIKSAIGNKLELNLDYMGEQELKNIREPIRTYRILSTRSPAKPHRILADRHQKPRCQKSL